MPSAYAIVCIETTNFGFAFPLHFFLLNKGASPHPAFHTTGKANVKKILVTGATSGIGRAIALRLHAEGHQVLALGRNRAALEALAHDAPGLEALALDLADIPAVEAALAGREVDVLVNNAGMMSTVGPFDALDPAEIAPVLAVNVAAPLMLTRLIAPQMRARQSGHIVFTGSSASYAPGANFALYAASKAAISAFATALRGDLSKDGVRVTEIVPGRVETALYDSLLSDASRAEMYEGGRSVQPEDIAAVLSTVLALPPHADVTRFDIMPTRPVPPAKTR